MLQLLRVLLSVLAALFRLTRRKPVRRKRDKVKVGRAAGVAEQARALAGTLRSIELPEGTWDPAETVRVEDGRVCVDLHGLSDEDAVAIVEDTLSVVRRPASLRLVTGHGRDRPAGYSLIRVALVRVLADRRDVQIDDLPTHRRHAQSDDRLGHMDVLAR